MNPYKTTLYVLSLDKPQECTADTPSMINVYKYFKNKSGNTTYLKEDNTTYLERTIFLIKSKNYAFVYQRLYSDVTGHYQTMLA